MEFAEALQSRLMKKALLLACVAALAAPSRAEARGRHLTRAEYDLMAPLLKKTVIESKQVKAGRIDADDHRDVLRAVAALDGVQENGKPCSIQVQMAAPAPGYYTYDGNYFGVSLYDGDKRLFGFDVEPEMAAKIPDQARRLFDQFDSVRAGKDAFSFVYHDAYGLDDVVSAKFSSPNGLSELSVTGGRSFRCVIAAR